MSDQGSSGNANGKPQPQDKPAEIVATPERQEIVPPALETALRQIGVDPRDPNVSKALEISLTMMFSGSLPLAPPPILKEYASIRPELVDKLVEWTEKQADHRRDLERLRTQGSEKRQFRAQWIGAVVALGGLVLAAYVGHYSAPTAIAIALVAIGGPTAAIWLAHNMRRPEPPKPPTAPIPPAPTKSPVS